MKKTLQNMPRKKSSIWILLFFTALLSYAIYSEGGLYKAPLKVSFSEFREDIVSKNIDNFNVELEGNQISYLDVKGQPKVALRESNVALKETLPVEDYELLNLTIKEDSSIWLDLLISSLPVVLIIAFFAMMFKQASSQNSQAMSFGKTRAKLYDKSKGKTTFDDVAGAKESKEELEEIVEFLKEPEKFTKLGAKIPRGVLLIGSPGTGKTLLARAVAGEADVPFFSISGSEFVEMFVGVGASRVRDMFVKAKACAPCIVFIDEIDAVGRQRGTGLGGGHDEREQTLNQILTEMDGFEVDSKVIVMAATNRPDVLDPALLRPGRFDRRVVVDRPDIKDRTSVLGVHVRKKPLDKDVNLEKIAKQTPGFTGADLENLVNEAAILAAREDKKKINQSHLERSVEKVALGPEKKSRVLSEKEREITAYHEVGHALVGHLLENCDPVHKISIISRGQALGVTWYLPEEDTHLYSVSKYKDQLSALLGGYVAEEIFFGEVTTGPSSDLERAASMARSMVTRFGMGDFGPVAFGEDKNEVFLGRDYGHVKNYSEKMAYEIDQKVSQIINDAYKITKEIISKNKKLMDKISKDLLEKENISREEFLAYFK